MTRDDTTPARDVGNRPWDEFWASEGARGGCLPTAMAEIDAVQAECWRSLARSLPPRAKTLDLATGDGRVMAHMIAARPDLRPIGVDLAARLPPPPKGCRVRAGIKMEKLPFADDSFACVTSQFGFEYGNIALVAAEMARILPTGGHLGLMMHRKDGPILTHNVARRAGLVWALDEIGLIAKVRAGLSLRAIGIIVPPAVAAMPATAVERFGPGSAAWEICAATIETLRGGANSPVPHVLETLAILEAKARNEIGRIDSLEQACETVSDAESTRQLIVDAGFAIGTWDAIGGAGAVAPFATFVTARLS